MARQQFTWEKFTVEVDPQAGEVWRWTTDLAGYAYEISVAPLPPTRNPGFGLGAPPPAPTISLGPRGGACPHCGR
jgi:hypothetical protein